MFILKLAKQEIKMIKVLLIFAFFTTINAVCFHQYGGIGEYHWQCSDTIGKQHRVPSHLARSDNKLKFTSHIQKWRPATPDAIAGQISPTLEARLPMKSMHGVLRYLTMSII